jgi:hypothetical protein
MSEDALLMVLRGLPEKISTGTGRIKNPVHIYRGEEGCTVFEGSVNNFDWKRQLHNFEKLQEVLKRNKEELIVIAAANFPILRWRYPGSHVMKTSFIAVSGSGKCIWYKYEGSSPGDGQNHIYINGKRMKLSAFLNFSEKKQDQFFKEE